MGLYFSLFYFPQDCAETDDISYRSAIFAEECTQTMKEKINNDTDRIFLFRDPLLEDSESLWHDKGKARISRTRDEVDPEFTSAMERMVAKVKDILDDPKTKPLVESAEDLEDRLQVLCGRGRVE